MLFAILVCSGVAGALPRVTLQECLDSAAVNYPLIRKYRLMSESSALSLQEINSGWLPRVSLTAQSTWQNAVPEFPAKLTSMMSQMGGELKGIPHWQYRAGVEVNQTVWDGGASVERRNVETASEALRRASLDADMYAIRQRIADLYFGLLLMRDQMAQSRTTHALLVANLERVRVLVKGGAALASDADMIEAQALSLQQQIVQAENVAEGYARVLEMFTGIDIARVELTLPDATVPTDLTPNRPELAVFGLRQGLNDASQRLSDTALYPKIGLFVQGFYGNPGLDSFKSMSQSGGSWNMLGGLKASWNIDAFYTRNSVRRRTQLSNLILETERDALLQSLNTQGAQQLAAIRGLQRVAESDARLVELRGNVRRVAESKLQNGVIDATDLLSKITDENIALLNASYHSIQIAQEIFRLKNTLNIK